MHLLVPPLLATELRLEPAILGLVIAAFGVAALAARLPVGLAYRRSRAAPLMLVAGAATTLAYLGVAGLSDATWAAPLLALDGAGWSTATTVLLATLADDQDDGRSTSGTMGWYLGIVGLGNAAGGAGGVLADLAGLRTAFLMLALLSAAASVVAAFALRSIVANDALVQSRGASSLQPRRALRTVGKLPELVRRVPAAVWAAMVVMLHINIVNGLLNAFHPILALRAGLSLSEIGVLSSVRSLASSWTRVASGPLFSRVSAASFTNPLLVVGTGAVVILPVVAGSFWWQVPLFMAVGVSRGFLRVTASVAAFDAARERDLSSGVVSALLHAGLDIGRLGGPLVAGVAAQLAGVPAAFVVVPAGLALAYGLFASRSMVSRRHAAD